MVTYFGCLLTVFYLFIILDFLLCLIYSLLIVIICVSNCFLCIYLPCVKHFKLPLCFDWCLAIKINLPSLILKRSTGYSVVMYWLLLWWSDQSGRRGRGSDGPQLFLQWDPLCLVSSFSRWSGGVVCVCLTFLRPGTLKWCYTVAGCMKRQRKTSGDNFTSVFTVFLGVYFFFPSPLLAWRSRRRFFESSTNVGPLKKKKAEQIRWIFCLHAGEETFRSYFCHYCSS